MDVLFLIGRILFAALFVSSSVGHLTRSDQMAGFAESRGVRPAKPAVMGTGIQIGLGALLVVLGIWMDVGFILIALFLLGTAFLMHPFWRESDAQSRAMEQIQFMKDLALAGAAIMGLAAVWHLGGELGITITGPLFTP